jgi:hypothetical protein
MQENFVHDLGTRETDERTPPQWQERDSQFTLQEQLQETVWKQLNEERLGEGLFLIFALLVWGWHLFLLYNALQEYTIAPWP